MGKWLVEGSIEYDVLNPLNLMKYILKEWLTNAGEG